MPRTESNPNPRMFQPEVGMSKVQSSHESSGADRLSAAESLHKTLDTRLQELARRAHLTPSEQLELADIKKQKLKLKDEIHALRGGTS
jgi:uncharacterized protein YdcH (DUF465 family)